MLARPVRLTYIQLPGEKAAERGEIVAALRQLTTDRKEVTTQQ
jgi:hypothetical protein